MKLWQILSIAVLVAAVALSGCISATPNVTATPTPVPATATPVPSPTEAPPEIGMEHGTQVRLSSATVSLAKTSNLELQAENFTLTFENIGDTPVHNVGFRFAEKDLRKGWELFSQGYSVGTIPGNSQVSYNLTTPVHKEAYSVTADIEIIWGENLEYNSTYQKSFTLVGLP
jgi:hypothetical protein